MIEGIRRKILRQEYKYSLHAAEQSILRQIARREVEEAIETGAVIEDYPSDKYGPSCLAWVALKPEDGCRFSVLIRFGPGSKSSRFMNPILRNRLISSGGDYDEV